MRAVTLKNNVLDKHIDNKVYIVFKGVSYEIGKVFVTDDKKDESGNITEYGKILLYAGEPLMDKKK